MNLAAILWGFAEGTLFFFVPDVFLSAAGLVDSRRDDHRAACVQATKQENIAPRGAIFFLTDPEWISPPRFSDRKRQHTWTLTNLRDAAGHTMRIDHIADQHLRVPETRIQSIEFEAENAEPKRMSVESSLERDAPKLLNSYPEDRHFKGIVPPPLTRCWNHSTPFLAQFRFIRAAKIRQTVKSGLNF